MTEVFSELARRRSTVLILHAHPDDETLATGAASAYLAQQGCRVVLRVASKGEAGEPTAASVKTARMLRMRRFNKACHRLGIADWGVIDEGRWLDTGGKPEPGSLTCASVAELSDAIGPHVKQIAPKAVLTVGSDGLTGHPDHILMHMAVQRAVGGIVPIFGATLQTSDVEAGHRLLAKMLPGTPVGSGRVTGTTRPLITFRPPSTAAEARRHAMNFYGPGLGTSTLDELIRYDPRRGDSLLLRAVMDAVDRGEEWVPATNSYRDLERYEPTPTT